MLTFLSKPKYVSFCKTLIYTKKFFSESINVCIAGSGPAGFYTAQHLLKAYGADEDQRLGVPGEDLSNVLSARKFVGWYNGLPEDTDLQVNLDVETAVIVGQGNVALDVARILLAPIDTLKGTDITEQALAGLSRSRVKRVMLVGRRGPLQVAFTIKELRELVKMEDCRDSTPQWQLSHLEPTLLTSLPRPRKRLTELMVQSAKSTKVQALKEWQLRFFRRPLSIQPNGAGAAGGIVLGVNVLLENQQIKHTEENETMECQLVFRSIGYKSSPLAKELPFDRSRGIIPNERGKVQEAPNLFCSGWVKTGPIGVIVSTMGSSFETGQSLLDRIGQENHHPPVTGRVFILELLKRRGKQVVNFEDWEKIDSQEKEQGRLAGKPREKFTRIQDMLRAAR